MSIKRIPNKFHLDDFKKKEDYIRAYNTPPLFVVFMAMRFILLAEKLTNTSRNLRELL